MITVMLGRFVATYHFPCMPDLAGYLMLDECQPKSVGEAAQPEMVESQSAPFSLEEFLTPTAKLGIVCWNWWCLSCLYINFNCDIICFSYLPCFFFTKVIRFITNILGNPHVAKQRKVRLIRQLQVLLVAYNDVHQRFGVVCGVGQSALILTLCTYALIKLGDQLIPIHFIFFFAAGTQALLTIIFVFGVLGNVYGTSETMIEEAKKVVELQEDAWFRRVLKSCPKQKIRFGEVNYLDSLTPFTLINFSVSLTVNMLLVET